MRSSSCMQKAESGNGQIVFGHRSTKWSFILIFPKLTCMLVRMWTGTCTALMQDNRQEESLFSFLFFWDPSQTDMIYSKLLSKAGEKWRQKLIDYKNLIWNCPTQACYTDLINSKLLYYTANQQGIRDKSKYCQGVKLFCRFLVSKKGAIRIRNEKT